jgi:predicted short-subunit dehydrogenase-like oxidoreductase (DUF2520 family)
VALCVRVSACYSPPVAIKPTIAIVGAGRLGTALALALDQAGYSVREIVSRSGPGSKSRVGAVARKIGATPVVFSHGGLKADLVWLCVPDREISAVAAELARKKLWHGKFAFHSSGALTSDELNALRKQGKSVASVHPMMTFVTGSTPPLENVPFALEGDAAALMVARSIVRNLGGEPFTLSKSAKPAYHAWGSFLSPLIVAVLVTSEEVAKAAGLTLPEARRRMMPIVRQTIANYAALGAAGAFTGPLGRGDTQTVHKHLRALKKIPKAKEVYIALAKSAVRHLPVERRKHIEKMLKG